MKKINIDLIKDIFISILIVICIALIISLIFYDKIALSKVVPESEDYMMSEEMEEELNAALTDDSTEIVTTYYIDAADLKKYETTKEYNKGKQNPFAVETEITNGDIGESGNNIDLGGSTSTSNSTNFYEDDGTK